MMAKTTIAVSIPFAASRLQKNQKEKEVDAWLKNFSALFKPMFRKDKQYTVVLLNAIGYIFVNMYKAPDYEGKAAFMPKLQAAEKVSPQNLLKWTTSYAAVVKGDSAHEWSSNLLMGLSMTLASFPECKWVICERKQPVGDSLKFVFSTSWSKYLILSTARAKERRDAAMKVPTGPFSDAERDGYKKEIANLQAYIIGNPTQVLTQQQVKALAGNKWDANILKGGKSPKQCFMQLKNKDNVITRDQWEQYYSSIASLRHTDAGKAGGDSSKTEGASAATADDKIEYLT